MTPETLKALKDSIAKWEKNVEAEGPDQVLLEVKDCPLCGLFFREGCVGCPVNARRCGGTPYEDASESWQDWEWVSAYYSEAQTLDEREDFRLAAQREVDFLKSLLPEES